jgi:hypothetical protein
MPRQTDEVSTIATGNYDIIAGLANKVTLPNQPCRRVKIFAATGNQDFICLAASSDVNPIATGCKLSPNTDSGWLLVSNTSLLTLAVADTDSSASYIAQI